MGLIHYLFLGPSIIKIQILAKLPQTTNLGSNSNFKSPAIFLPRKKNENQKQSPLLPPLAKFDFKPQIENQTNNLKVKTPLQLIHPIYKYRRHWTSPLIHLPPSIMAVADLPSHHPNKENLPPTSMPPVDRPCRPLKKSCHRKPLDEITHLVHPQAASALPPVLYATAMGVVFLRLGVSGPAVDDGSSLSESPLSPLKRKRNVGQQREALVVNLVCLRKGFRWFMMFFNNVLLYHVYDSLVITKTKQLQNRRKRVSLSFFVEPKKS